MLQMREVLFKAGTFGIFSQDCGLCNDKFRFIKVKLNMEAFDYRSRLLEFVKSRACDTSGRDTDGAHQ